MRSIYLFLFYRVFKWKFNGQLPDLKKYMIIVAPHTSNLDFFVGLAVRSILYLKTSFLGKKELFRPPYGWIFRMLGGYPVDRSQPANLVYQVAAIFDSKEDFKVAIAPEGTRKYVKKWKSGFYYMALKSKVPIVMVSFDFRDKTVYIAEPFWPSGVFEDDLPKIADFFRLRQGRYPKEFPY